MDRKSCGREYRCRDQRIRRAHYLGTLSLLYDVLLIPVLREDGTAAWQTPLQRVCYPSAERHVDSRGHVMETEDSLDVASSTFRGDLTHKQKVISWPMAIRRFGSANDPDKQKPGGGRSGGGTGLTRDAVNDFNGCFALNTPQSMTRVTQ